MATHLNLRVRPLLVLLASTVLGACASTSHVTAFQERPVQAPPRRVALALDQGETLPFGIAPDLIADMAARAGFELSSDAPRYRLALTGAMGATDAGSYLPAANGAPRPSWVARPDRNWRARFAGGHVLRITAVLIDVGDNREVWRGTGTLRTSDPRGTAPELVREVLARLPHG